MRDNFGGDEKKDGEKKDGESSRRVRRDGEGANGRTNGEKARRGLDPDLFAGAERVAAVPSGDRAGAAGKSRRGGDDERTGVRSREAVNRQRAEAAARARGGRRRRLGHRRRLLMSSRPRSSGLTSV